MGVECGGRVTAGVAVAEDKGQTLTFRDGERRPGTPLPQPQGDRAAEDNEIRADAGNEAEVAGLRPRRDLSIVETQIDRQFHLHLSPQADDDSDQRGTGFARRHEVDHAHRGVAN